MSAYLVREILARNGLNPDRRYLLAIGGTSARSAALFGGTIDAALVVAPDNYPLERKGYRRLLLASDYANHLSRESLRRPIFSPRTRRSPLLL